MTKSINEKFNTLSNKRQMKIKSRASELIKEEMTLRDLRVAMNLTQNDICAELHMKQDGVSRLERRTDVLLSTLRRYVNSMGGDLKLTVEFPERPPVIIKGLGELNNESRATDN